MRKYSQAWLKLIRTIPNNGFVWTSIRRPSGSLRNAENRSSFEESFGPLLPCYEMNRLIFQFKNGTSILSSRNKHWKMSLLISQGSKWTPQSSSFKMDPVIFQVFKLFLYLSSLKWTTSFFKYLNYSLHFITLHRKPSHFLWFTVNPNNFCILKWTSLFLCKETLSCLIFQNESSHVWHFIMYPPLTIFHAVN